LGVGGSKTLRETDHDQVTLIGAGVTLHAALAAADTLAHQGITARVIDAYSIKPIDSTTLAAAAAATAGRIVIAEDHHPEGGLGSAVIDSLTTDGIPGLHITHLAVRDMPGSGTSDELLAWAGIDANHITTAAQNLLTNK
jgi:transketolase